MDCYKLDFAIRKFEMQMDYTALVSEYIEDLYRKGRILKSYLVTRGREGISVLVQPRQESIPPQQVLNILQSQAPQPLLDYFEISAAFYGEAVPNQMLCDCEEPGWYLISAAYGQQAGPVFCGDCGKAVPLYKLPYPCGQEDHAELLDWQELFQSAETLYLKGLSDTIVYSWLNQMDSSLNQTGRALCSQYEQKTGVPVYYYQYHYTDTPPVCPVCQKPWTACEGDGAADYQCPACRIAADE